MPASEFSRHSTWMLICLIGLVFSAIAVWVTFAQLKRDYNDEPATHWALAGNLTSTSASFRIRDNQATLTQTLVVSTQSDFSNPVSTTDITSSLTGELVRRLIISGLTPQTQYYYRLATPGASTVYQTGKFRTPAPEGQAFDFKIVAAGCAWSFSDDIDVYQEMANEDADLFLHLGDLHYEDIDSSDLSVRINAIDKVLGSGAQRPLFSTGGLVYMWDDHDFTGNDSGESTSSLEGRLTALESYQVAFPHYPLALENAARVPVYHAFTYGSVRFVVSDLRSEATATSIYSLGQKQWLFQEFAQAANYDFVVWVTTRPWIEAAEAGIDSWGGYADNRTELSTYITSTIGADAGPKNLIAIAADSHMIAMDDGTNTYYGNGGGGQSQITSFPILVSGPMDRLGSNKGGPYSEGCHTTELTRNHQYSLIQFSFASGNPCLDIYTYRKQQFGDKEEIFHRSLCGNLFQPASADKSGSCDYKRLLPGDIAMLSISLGFWFFLFIAACYIMKCFMSTVVMTLVLGFWVVVLGWGVAIPTWKGVDQYNSFPSILVAMCYMVAVCCCLGGKMYQSYKDDQREVDEEEVEQEYEEEVIIIEEESEHVTESRRKIQEMDEAPPKRGFTEEEEEEYRREEEEYQRGLEEEERRRQEAEEGRQSGSGGRKSWMGRK